MTALLQDVDRRGVATLTLNRPDRHNALDGGLIAHLTEELSRIGARSDIRAIVLSGSGTSFCAGADLAWMQQMARADEAENRRDALALARLLHTLNRSGKPTLAIVQGAAYGGGVGLVACCDVVVASERASFCLSEVRLGLIPAAISPYVVAAIGARQARRYFITAEVFQPAQARQMGLVHELVAHDALDEARDRMLHAVLQGGPVAQAEAKDLVFLCQSHPADAALAEETSRRIAARRASTEGQEGIAAFLERRRPAWREN